RLLDKGVKVSRTRGGLRLALRCNADLRFRSLGWFFGHRPTPWIFGFARRYISRPGSGKRCAKDRGLLKALRASSRSRVAAAVLSSYHPLVGLHNQLGRGFDTVQGGDLDPRSEPSPTLGRRRPTSETRRIPEVTRARKDEHLDPTLQGPDFREDPIPVAAPPGNPVSAHVLFDSIPPADCHRPNPLS